MTQKMLGEMAARANVNTVVLTHLTYSPAIMSDARRKSGNTSRAR
jgi:hypothetical protein